jgi:tetratricopeptide (TPR) repeat protein
MNELEEKYAELSEWKEKVAFFKKKESTVSDVEQQFTLDKKIKEAQGRILILENEINSIEKLDVTQPKSEIETLHQAMDLFIKQTEKLNHKSEPSDLEEIEKLKSELKEKLFGDYNQKIISTPALQNRFIINLFEKIASSERLSQDVIDDINLARNEKEMYKYHERCVIVSALTLSVLTWKKFDPKKINILVDFLTDFEDEVWERALVGIVLSTIVHQNRLQKHNLVERLQALQQIEKVQVGIYLIDTVLRNQLYKSVFTTESIIDEDFFVDNPHNWFLPFYEDNPTIKDMLENTEQDIEEDKFLNFIHNVPFLSSVKYSICNGMINGTKEAKIDKENEHENEISDYFDKIFKMSSSLNPFYNIISEFFLYYKYYPADRVNSLFARKITLAETKLKNIILGKVQALKLSADLHYERKEYGSCISKLKELLNIEPNQFSALVQITDCYEHKDEYNNALNYHYQIEKLKPNEFTSKLRLAVCLTNLDQFKKSIEFLLSANAIIKDDIYVLT